VSISIVMISFNQVEFLAKAMYSVLNQESVDLQLVIVDPGSTDGSREFAQRVANKDDRVILIFESDSGPADGLNKGFKRAENEIVGYLNSDDIYLPSALRIIEINFKLHVDVDVIYGHGLILDERTENKLDFAYSDQLSKTKILTNTARIMQQSTFFRKASLDESNILFNTENRTCWDYEFIVDALLAGLSFVRLDKIIGVLRVHAKSITGSNLNYQKYEADKGRIIDAVLPKFNVINILFYPFFSIGYRIIRKFKVFGFRIRFKGQMKEFAKNENISFME
jgi:glycosyltransferase involved in cell wall biosynthesis